MIVSLATLTNKLKDNEKQYLVNLVSRQCWGPRAGSQPFL